MSVENLFEKIPGIERFYRLCAHRTENEITLFLLASLVRVSHLKTNEKEEKTSCVNNIFGFLK